MNDCRFLTIAQSSASLAYHKPIAIDKLKNCSGGGARLEFVEQVSPQNLRRENGQYSHRGEWLLSAQKQSPWTLLAQFSLSRERDVANIIA
jgi:hypothetical protein